MKQKTTACLLLLLRQIKIAKSFPRKNRIARGDVPAASWITRKGEPTKRYAALVGDALRYLVAGAICMCVVLLASCGLFGNKNEAQPIVQSAEVSEDVTAEQKRLLRTFTVAVMLPDIIERKWSESGEQLVLSLEKFGYGADVYFAENNAKLQAEQIAEAIESRVRCIIIAAVDSYSPEIRDALDNAKSANIPVVAYDRLVMDTESIGTYVGYDPYMSGRLCAQAIMDALDFSGGFVNIEVFSPDSSSSSSEYFYHGAMDVLMPHIDSGRISVPSGMTSFESTAPDGITAGERMDSILSAHYAGGRRLDAVLAPDDVAALGIIKSLESAGYGFAGPFPYVTGSGCNLENIHEIMDGKQLVSLFTDERSIAAVAAEAADFATHQISPGDADKTTYYNGKVVVPAVLSEPVPVTIDNYKELLIGSDYYNYKDVQH